MLSSTLLGHYVPVTWLSFALDYVLWGFRPFGFHLTNIVLHEITASLVCFLTTRLLARATAWPAATCAFGGVAAALPWGLHPLRVEAVSWATGRRDVLSAFLLCLALGAWLMAINREGSSRRRWQSAAVAAYALALGAKSVVMMTPPAMVALDVYPLRRLPLDVRRWHAPTVRAVWLEKIPFAIMAVLAAATAIAAFHGHRLRGPGRARLAGEGPGEPGAAGVEDDGAARPVATLRVPAVGRLHHAPVLG